MRKIIVGVILCLFAVSGVAHATVFRANRADLKISGTPISGLVVATGQTVTSDSLYQMGNAGFQSLATKVSGATSGVTITYQVSYDNSTWWTPYTTNSGTLTAAGTLSSSQTANRWVVVNAMLAPYIRFSFANGATGDATISATTLWQTSD